MSPMGVLGVGECSLDLLVEVEGPLPERSKRALPAAGARFVEALARGDRAPGALALPGQSEIGAERVALRPGGQVATAMLGCARLGLETRFVGAVGDDGAAARILEPLAAAAVDLESVSVLAGVASRLALILVDPASGERRVLEHRDPRLRIPFRADWLSERTGALLVDGSDLEASLAAAHEARRRGVPVVLDLDVPAPEASELLALADFPVVSRAFAEEHAGTTNLRDAMRVLREDAWSDARGQTDRLAVITCGEQGALASVGDQLIEVPAFPVVVRDTTGAGDAFRAGFVWALLEGRRGQALVQRASAVAALNCSGRGAQEGLPTLAAVRKFLEEHHVR